MKVVINTSTFGKFSREPLEILADKGIECVFNPYKRTLKEEEVVELAKDVVGVIAGVEPLNAKVLDELSTVKVISRCGVGMDNVDIEKAKELGMEVFNTPSGPTVAVAELTIAVILNLLRKVNLMDSQVKSGIWQKQMGNLLSGKKVGIIGFGRIGQKVAELLGVFNVEIGYYDLNLVQNTQATRFDSLKELLPWADIVSIHLSGSADLHNLISEKEISLMKDQAWLVNMSRGGIINEEVLYNALQENKLAGAALDVFEQEPYEGELKELENVVLTPHIGSYGKEARIEMEIESVKNLIKGLKL